MTEVKIYCDHCGKELDEMKDYADIKIELAHLWKKHDLCTDCLEKLKVVVDNFCTNSQPRKDDEG